MEFKLKSEKKTPQTEIDINLIQQLSNIGK